jgi:hypothetical protein
MQRIDKYVGNMKIILLYKNTVKPSRNIQKIR